VAEDASETRQVLYTPKQGDGWGRGKAESMFSWQDHHLFWSLFNILVSCALTSLAVVGFYIAPQVNYFSCF